MKKIIALLLTALVIAGLAACSAKVDSADKAGSDSKASAEKPSELAAEEATAIPTEPVTEAPEEHDGDTFVYADKSGLWETDVPVIWQSMGAIVEYSNDESGTYYAKFVHKEAYEAGAGHIFTIATCVDPDSFMDVSILPQGEELYRSDSVQIYVIYPSDVQLAIDGDSTAEALNEQNEEFDTLRKTKQGVFDSIRWLD